MDLRARAVQTVFRPTVGLRGKLSQVLPAHILCNEVGVIYAFDINS
jgi:hypothetical protein